jgi:hypothetical protein
VDKIEEVPLAVSTKAYFGKVLEHYGLSNRFRLVLAQAGVDAVDVRIEGGDAAHVTTDKTG